MKKSMALLVVLYFCFPLYFGKAQTLPEKEPESPRLADTQTYLKGLSDQLIIDDLMS